MNDHDDGAKTMNKRWRPSVTVAAVIEHEGRFLLVEEHTPEGLKLNNPAGHLEPGETPAAAVVREVLEETGREFVPEALLGIYLARFVRPRAARPQRTGRSDERPRPPEDITYLRLAYCGQVGEPLPERTLDPAIVRTLWLTRDELAADAARHRSPLVMRCIDDHLAGRRLPLDAVHGHASLSEPMRLPPIEAPRRSDAAGDHDGGNATAAERPSRSARRRARKRMQGMHDISEGAAGAAAALPAGATQAPADVAAAADAPEGAALPAVTPGEAAPTAEAAAACGAAEAPAAGAPAGAAASAEAPAAAAVRTRPEPTLAETTAALAERFPALFTPGQPRPIKLRIQADIQARSHGAFTRKQLSIFLHRHTTSTAYLRALVASPQRFDLDGQPAGEVAAEHIEAAKIELERRRHIVMQRRGLLGGPGAAPGLDPSGAPGMPSTPGAAAAERPPRPARAGPGSGGAGAPGRRAHFDRPPRTDQAGQGDRPARGDRPSRAGRPGGPGHAGHPGRSDRPDRPERPGGGPWRGPDRGLDRGERPLSRSAQGPRPAAAEATIALPEDPERRERALLLRSFEGSPLTAANFCALKGLALGDFETQIAQARREREERQRGGGGGA